MIRFTRLVFVLVMFATTVANAQTHLYIIGDSTTENWDHNWYPCMGWGAVFQHFFDRDKVVVDNRAVGGRSSQTFYDQHWKSVLADIKSGDYLFICFGANDSNGHAFAYVTLEDFHKYIGMYCKEAREKGAIPVLLSTINANHWYADDMYLSTTYGTYPQAMGKAAEEYETPYFDLNTFGAMLTQNVGPEYNTYYRYNNYKPGEYQNYPEGIVDHVHLQETGATDFCRYIVEEIEKSDDERLKLLAEATKPRYDVTFDVDDPDLISSISRSATFPEGINVTLKNYAIDENQKCCWKDRDGKIVSKSSIDIYVMQDHDEHFTAVYKDTANIQNAEDKFLIYSDKIQFLDNELHTIKIFSFDGKERTSATTQFSYEFNIQPGAYILTIDGKTSTKVLVCERFD